MFQSNEKIQDFCEEKNIDIKVQLSELKQSKLEQKIKYLMIDAIKPLVRSQIEIQKMEEITKEIKGKNSGIRKEKLQKLVKEKRFVFYLCGTIQIQKTILIKCLLYYWIMPSESQLNCAWV